MDEALAIASEWPSLSTPGERDRPAPTGLRSRLSVGWHRPCMAGAWNSSPSSSCSGWGSCSSEPPGRRSRPHHRIRRTATVVTTRRRRPELTEPCAASAAVAPLESSDAPDAAPPSAPRLTPKEILGRLNPPQREAVSHLSGPLLILAGAGSGKTRVLAHRVAYLVATSYKPWQIVAVTFTNKAANEMRQRIAGLIGEEAAREATIGTFHAICARILRRDGEAIGLTRSFTIYDRADQVALVKSVLQNGSTSTRSASARPGCWPGSVSARTSWPMSPPPRRQAANYYDETAARVYDAYQRQLGEDDAVDFDDLLHAGRLPVRAASRRSSPATRRAGSRSSSTSTRTRTAPSTCICRQLAAKHQQPGRGRRRRPEHLLLARRRPAQHPRLRGRLSRRQGREARAELPLDPDDPRRGARRRQPQRGPQGQEAVDRSRHRRADHAVRRLQRVRGGRVRRAPGREAGRRRAPRRR